IFARNITDIDDKILKKMAETNQSLDELTTFYTQRFRAEMAEIGCQNPDIEPKATEAIDKMIEIIELLLKNGAAYQLSNGDVYFDSQSDKEYLSISGRKESDDSQSRIEHNDGKKRAADFALWKRADEGVVFESPFGAGRPGWHLECSAIIKKYLADDGEYQIDIHGGGADLLFPHHENEAAQTRMAYGVKLANFWLHNGFVNIDGEKMSKSLGNSFFLKDAIAAYGGEVIRNYLLQTHYRSDFNFNEIDLLSSKKRLDKIYRLKKRVEVEAISEADGEFKKEILDALSDDLNIAEALSALEKMISNANEALDKNPKDRVLKAKIGANIVFVYLLLGIGDKNTESYFQSGVNENDRIKIEDLILKRTEVKKAKDFKTADLIRDELLNMGISLMDAPNKTIWEKI
ncbi:MAG: cysteinyl-tRNA synthetase, partial [Pseudomonadota bacterium]